MGDLGPLFQARNTLTIHVFLSVSIWCEKLYDVGNNKSPLALAAGLLPGVVGVRAKQFAWHNYCSRFGGNPQIKNPGVETDEFS
jgi:hypothetical protein